MGKANFIAFIDSPDPDRDVATATPGAQMPDVSPELADRLHALLRPLLDPDPEYPRGYWWEIGERGAAPANEWVEHPHPWGWVSPDEAVDPDHDERAAPEFAVRWRSALMANANKGRIAVDVWGKF